MPEISVIMPLYNTIPYLREAVESVLHQTFQDFELIIVDDASTDGSYELCRKLYGGNEKIRIFRHEKNKTTGGARNTGLEEARGKYIAFLDSDDLYMPEALSIMHQAAESCRADIVHSPGCYLPNGDMEHIGTEDDFRVLVLDQLPMPQGMEKIPLDPALRTSLWAQRKLSGAVWNKLFKLAFLKGHGIRFEDDIVPGQDAVFLFRCVFYAPVYVRVPDIFYIYRRPASSVTRTKRDAVFLSRLVECMVRKVRSLDRYMESMAYFLEHPLEREQVRKCAVLDTDPFFVQECYRRDGTVEGDMGQVRQVMEQLFGQDAWLMEYYFHAYHRNNKNNKPGRGMQLGYIFPWQLLPRGSRVVIYGAGEVGKCFYEQATRFSYVKLTGIVDKAADSISALGIPVQKISALAELDYDYVLISIINEEIAEKIRRDLLALGIEERKILWDGKNYSVDDYCNNIFFKMLEKYSVERN